MPYADKEKQKEYMRNWTRNKIAWLNKLKNKPCADCGNEFPSVCMDWYHLYGKDKDISRMKTYAKEKILKAIESCILICANCHRIRHYYNDK